MSQPEKVTARSNTRIVLILLSIAATFFAGIILKFIFFPHH